MRQPFFDAPHIFIKFPKNIFCGSHFFIIEKSYSQICYWKCNFVTKINLFAQKSFLLRAFFVKFYQTPCIFNYYMIKYIHKYFSYTSNTVHRFAKKPCFCMCRCRSDYEQTMELTGYEEPLAKIGDFIVYIVLAVFSCVLFIGSCILCTTDIQPVTNQGIPLIATVGFIFSIALGIFSVKKMWKR